jgi:hypothetical protein
MNSQHESGTQTVNSQADLTLPRTTNPSPGDSKLFFPAGRQLRVGHVVTPVPNALRKEPVSILTDQTAKSRLPMQAVMFGAQPCELTLRTSPEFLMEVFRGDSSD